MNALIKYLIDHVTCPDSCYMSTTEYKDAALSSNLTLYTVQDMAGYRKGLKATPNTVSSQSSKYLGLTTLCRPTGIRELEVG